MFEVIDLGFEGIDLGFEAIQQTWALRIDLGFEGRLELCPPFETTGVFIES